MNNTDVEINNTQYVMEKVVFPAGFFRRTFAFAVDHIILLLFLIFTAYFIPQKLFAKFIISRYTFSGIIFAIFLFVEIYFLIFELFGKGKTPGKWLFNIKVVDKNLNKPDFYTLIIRNSTRCLYLIPPFFLLPDLICYLITANKRIGDLLAKTQVVKDI